ncbi:uncharacterized protein LOC144329635 [Macaca mulatta]
MASESAALVICKHGNRQTRLTRSPFLPESLVPSFLSYCWAGRRDALAQGPRPGAGGSGLRFLALGEPFQMLNAENTREKAECSPLAERAHAFPCEERIHRFLQAGEGGKGRTAERGPVGVLDGPGLTPRQT